jgi:hypothetical protein
MINPVLALSFVIGAILSNLLVAQYGWGSRWRESVTGRVLLSLFAVIAVSYDLTVLAIFLPHIFDGGPGLTVRIGARLAIDAVLAGMYVLLVRAQRRDRTLEAEEVLIPPESAPTE